MSSAVQIELSNPFPGLRPFHEGEEHLFFGRESQVDAMIDKLSRSRFLAVVGTSGSGKSSLVNCGLRPALHRGLMATAGTSWRIAQFRPGSDPLKCMAKALAADGVLFSGFQSGALALEDMIEATLRMSKLGLVDICEQAQLGDGANLLVIADQFEELFRYRSLRLSAAGDGQDRTQEATAFVNLLLETKIQTGFPIYVVLTMRSDFLGDCSEFAGLPEAINEGQYLVPRMTRDERKAAIAGPVRVGGGRVSPVLLTRLVNDVGDNPDQLSILQHALNRTWARWQHEAHGEGQLELAHYEAIGTMAHALDQHAEKAFAELSSDRQRKICEKLFKALTDKAADSRGVRRPTRFSVLCALAGATSAEAAEVVDVFRKPSRSFLMPPLPDTLQPDSVIDISHESLMRVWDRLKLWADQEAQSAQVFRRLLETAALHAKGNAGLYRNPDLQLALEWRNKENPTETWAELHGGDFNVAMGFLASSEAQQEKEAREAGERQKRELEQAQALASAEEQAHSARRLRLLVIALAIVFLVAVMFAMAAKRQGIEATAAARVAEQQREKASNAEKDAAAAAARAANEAAKARAARAYADWLRKRAEGLEREAQKESAKDTKEKNEADSERLAETVIDNLDSKPELALLLSLEAAQKTYLPYRTVTADAGNALRRVAEAARLQLTLPAGSFQAISFTPEGKLLETATAASSRTGPRLQINRWNMDSGKQAGPSLPLAHLGSGSVRAVALSPDGRYVAAASQDGYARLWTLPEGSLVKEIQHAAGITAVAFTRDSRYLITGTDNKACVWDTNGLPIASLPHQGRVTALAVSSDAKWLATISQPSPDQTTGGSGAVTLWSDLTGKQPKSRVVETSGDAVSSIFFVDERRLATLGSARTLRIWDTTYNRQLLQIPRQGVGDIASLAFSLDGKQVATVGSDKRVTVWSAANGSEFFTLHGAGNVLSVTFSPDGKRLATATSDGNLKVWSTLPGNTLMDIHAHNDVIYRIAFSGDGHTLATASWDKTAKLWNPVTGNEVHTLSGHGAQVMGVAFSPDGKRIATCSVDHTAKVWDATSGKEQLTLTGHADQVMAVAFSPDGKRLATASWDKTVKIWDAYSGKEMSSLLGHKDHVEDVAFSPDGKWIASASSDRTARIWDANTGKQRLMLSGQLYWVLGVAFSPDSKRLATASADRTVRLWEIPSGRPLGALLGHTEMVRNVAFSPDGKWLASVSEDNTTRIWDSSSGEAAFALSGHADKIFGIAFSSDGSRLATAGADGRVLVYAWASEEVMMLTRGRVTRSLTAKECQDNKVKSNPCDAAIESKEGRDLAALGDVEGAVAAFREAQKADPSSISFDPVMEAKKLAARSLAIEGRNQASSGDVDSAVATFLRAKKLDASSISFNPQIEAKRLAALTKVTEGQSQASLGDVDGAIATLSEAKRLDPSLKLDPVTEANRFAAAYFLAHADTLLQQENFTAAMAAYSQGIAAYGRVPGLDGDGSIRANAWNNLCWRGSVRQHAAEVMDACENAVKQAEHRQPESWNYRDSRGLARALIGNREGAIQDFQFFVDHTDDQQHKSERQKWIAALRAGQNPFTPDVLKSLYDE